MSTRNDAIKAIREAIAESPAYVSFRTIEDELKLAEDIYDAMEELEQAEAALRRIRRIHYEFDGRCVHCVAWCECNLADRHQHNLSWPCPTMVALTATAVAAQLPLRNAQAAMLIGDIEENVQ